MNLNRLAYFAAVVDTGSFTRAAERLRITKAVVSQQVAQLERETGTTLLVRRTRRVHTTEAGRALHARCAITFARPRMPSASWRRRPRSRAERCASPLPTTTA
jgi:DNA-binding transcriptional LysR family regulator